jgi:hypothetical protein
MGRIRGQEAGVVLPLTASLWFLESLVLVFLKMESAALGALAPPLHVSALLISPQTV